MKHHRKTIALIVWAVTLGSVTGDVAAVDPAATDPRTIMKAVRDAQKISRSKTRVRMLIQDQSGKRERVLSTRVKRYDDAYKTLVLIEQPPDLRDTGFLSIEYSARDRSDEQWIYLPKLHRVSRLGDTGKSDPFVGSDFSIADLSIAGNDVDDFDLKLVEASAKVGDEDCWSIESKPRTPAVRNKTGYDRTQLWVSKSKLVVLQLKGTSIDGKKTKYLKAMDLRNVQGVWTPHRVQMRTLVGSTPVSETVLEVLSVDNDAKDVVDGDFSASRLERGS